MTQKKLVAYLDEHISAKAHLEFTSAGLSCVCINRTKRFSGRDERDYISEIASEGAIYVTSDNEFINWLADSGVKYYGIIWMPSMRDMDDSLWFYYSILASQLLKEININGKSSLWRKILYVSANGFSEINKGVYRLVLSYDALDHAIEEHR